MKKLYILLVAVLVAATASAQVTIKEVDPNMKRGIPTKIERSNAISAPVRGTIADEIWIHYPTFDALYWGGDSLKFYTASYFKFDTLGLYKYSDGYGRATFSASLQTFDFGTPSLFYDDLVGEGSMSFKYTSNLTLDSIRIRTAYERDSTYTAIDTLIVGVVTQSEENAVIYTLVYQDGTPVPNTCFVNYDRDPVTGVQVGADVYKVLLGPEDADDLYYVNFYVPVNKTTTDKIWSVAYAFKSGQNAGLNDTMKSSMSIYLDQSWDDNYWVMYDNELRCSNLSHGEVSTRMDDFFPNYAYGVNNPAWAFDEAIHIKVSCGECQIVNVPTVEKNNPTIYPNPATDKFQINLEEGTSANVQMFNLVGQQVYSGVVNGTETISTANLNSGVYMLKINQNGKIYTSKIIVK